MLIAWVDKRVSMCPFHTPRGLMLWWAQKLESIKAIFEPESDSVMMSVMKLFPPSLMIVVRRMGGNMRRFLSQSTA